MLGCILLGADGWPAKEGYDFRPYQPLVRLRHKVQIILQHLRDKLHASFVLFVSIGVMFRN